MQLTDTAPNADVPLPLQQTPAFAAALGRPHYWRSVHKGRRTIAHALVVKGPLGLPTSLRGPIWHDDPDPDERAAALRLIAPRLIEADGPDLSLPRAGYRQLVTEACVAEWLINRPEDDLRAGLHGKWRNALRQAEAAALKLRHAPFVGPADHPILRHQAALSRSRGFRTLSAEANCRLAAALPQGARLWEAWLKRECVAMMLFVRHGPVVTYYVGWSGDAGRASRAHHRMLFAAALWYGENGATRMDLGTVDTEGAPGLARFKIGTGANVRRLGGSHIRLI